MDNGPLVYYPGTHKLPEVSAQDLGLDPKWSEYKRYEDWVEAMIEKEGFEPHYATIGKGQALVWAANLLHGGAERRDPDRSRHSQVTHYFFEGCKYYTPMVSAPGNVRWRDPAWIT
jgi:ectoine hydroxylase-related dioxygenase (phytanoyl-CoA dioxygenase family)